MSNQKLRSDIELKSLAKEFFSKAQEAVMQDTAQMAAALQQGGGFRMAEGAPIFILGKEVSEAERKLTSRCVRLLGSEFGHEKELSELAWKAAQNAISNQEPVDTFLSGFFAALDDHAKKDFWCICPNYLVAFHSTIKKLTVGPVEAMPSADVLSQIPTHKQFDITSSEAFKESIINGRITIELPPIVWRVEVNCAAGHVAEEAAWKVDIAVSLLRLHYKNDPSGLLPRIGDIEPPPFVPSDGRKRHVTTTKTGLSTGGRSMPGAYVLDDEIVNVTLSPLFIDRATAIFSGNANHLSTRFGQGLGWLTRGRRSEDRAERFLFFFTAIEALLSSDDKTAPVVQTIARQASVILADDPKDRVDCSDRIKKLYEARSALVHAGKRDVSQADAKSAQYIAEALYGVVMERMKLDTPFADFQKGLSVATYGTKWP